MKKSELLSWLQQEYQQWEAFLEQIGTNRMEQHGAAGFWSMKDLTAHLTTWNRRLVAQIQAAQRAEPESPPPWPADMQSEDEINAWIYEANRSRTLDAVLEETNQMFQQLLAVIAGLSDEVQIEDEWRLVHLGDQRYPAGEFFDHFHDDHEPDIRAWLAQQESSAD